MTLKGMPWMSPMVGPCTVVVVPSISLWFDLNRFFHVLEPGGGKDVFSIP